jgi:hypothetical protein
MQGQRKFFTRNEKIRRNLLFSIRETIFRPIKTGALIKRIKSKLNIKGAFFKSKIAYG